MISDVIKTPLKQFEDTRGKVMHMLRADSSQFKVFGEVYFSWVYVGAIKAWKMHKELTSNFAVPVGSMQLILYDDRADSPSYGSVNEFYMGSDDYYLLTIPNNIWYGFRAVGDKPAMIVNCATMPHHPSESEMRDIDDPRIPYVWGM